MIRRPLAVAVVLACLACAVPAAAGSGDTLTNTVFGFTFEKLPDWTFLRAGTGGPRVLDVVRLLEDQVDGAGVRKPLQARVHARILLEAHPAGAESFAAFARRLADGIRNQGFAVETARRRVEQGLDVHYYLLAHEPPRDSRERVIWTTLRCFQARGVRWAYQAAAFSRAELDTAETMFRTLRFAPR